MHTTAAAMTTTFQLRDMSNLPPERSRAARKALQDSTGNLRGAVGFVDQLHRIDVTVQPLLPSQNFILPKPARPTAFGHLGTGGSTGVGDIDNRVAIAFVANLRRAVTPRTSLHKTESANQRTPPGGRGGYREKYLAHPV